MPSLITCLKRPVQGVLFRIAVYRGKKVKSRPVRDQLPLQMKNRVTYRNLEEFMDGIVGFKRTDTLFATLNLYLISLSQYVKKRLVLEFSVAEPWKVYVWQVIQIIEYGCIIHESQPLNKNTTRFAEFFAERENEIPGPLCDHRF
jgi:hypothetical protein